MTSPAKSDQPILLEVKNLRTWFPIRRGLLAFRARRIAANRSQASPGGPS